QRSGIALLLLPRDGDGRHELLDMSVDLVLALRCPRQRFRRPFQVLLRIELEPARLICQVREAAQLAIERKRRLRQLARLVGTVHVSRRRNAREWRGRSPDRGSSPYGTRR